jgi:hypothetical protein
LHEVVESSGLLFAGLEKFLCGVVVHFVLHGNTWIGKSIRIDAKSLRDLGLVFAADSPEQVDGPALKLSERLCDVSRRIGRSLVAVRIERAPDA